MTENVKYSVWGAGVGYGPMRFYIQFFSIVIRDYIISVKLCKISRNIRVGGGGNKSIRCQRAFETILGRLGADRESGQNVVRQMMPIELNFPNTTLS